MNYERDDLREAIRKLTDNQGVDVVYDPVGGRFAEPALRGMAWGGRYLVVGFAAGDIPKVPFNLALLNLVLVGPAAFATGQAIANTWRHWGQMVFYTALLSATLRFLDYALAGGELWSVAGFLLGWAVQMAIGAVAYRFTRARQMVRQYPWLYRRKGLLDWEERH